MKFAVDKKENFAVFTIMEEKLNSIVAPDLKTELALLSNEGHKNIILDLENINFIDSSGLSAILIGNRLCQGIGGMLVVSAITDSVNRLIKISQLDTVLRIIPTVNEAKDYIKLEALMQELKGGDDADSDADTNGEADAV